MRVAGPAQGKGGWGSLWAKLRALKIPFVFKELWLQGAMIVGSLMEEGVDFFVMLVENIENFAFLLIAMVVLLFLREIFIIELPKIVKVAWDAFEFLIKIMVESIYVVYKAVKAIGSLFHHGSIPSIPDRDPDKWFRGFSTYISLPDRCAKFDNWQAVVGGLTRRLGNSRVCPTARILHRLPWLFRAYDALTGWLYFDSTPAPGNNCEVPDDFIVCEIAGTGYVCEFLILVLFFALLAMATPKTRKHIILFVWYLVRLVDDTIDALTDIFEAWLTHEEVKSTNTRFDVVLDTEEELMKRMTLVERVLYAIAKKRMPDPRDVEALKAE